MPGICGGGQSLVNRLLSAGADSTLGFWPLFLIFGMRFLLTMGSYGTGAAGGIFAPLLVLGALLGLGVGQLGREWAAPLAAPEPLTMAVAGMAAYFTAIVRAPLTGIVLIIEMTAIMPSSCPC